MGLSYILGWEDASVLIWAWRGPQMHWRHSNVFANELTVLISRIQNDIALTASFTSIRDNSRNQEVRDRLNEIIITT